jgi:hypothetical protein
VKSYVIVIGPEKELTEVNQGPHSRRDLAILTVACDDVLEMTGAIEDELRRASRNGVCVPDAMLVVDCDRSWQRGRSHLSG